MPKKQLAVYLRLSLEDTGANDESNSITAQRGSGDVSCIVVKDLSRFARNYIEAGDYLEHIFPYLGIRFIAVNNHYDSDQFIGTTGGIDVAFRNFMYEMYSVDISKKVKTSQHMLMRSGR